MRNDHKRVLAENIKKYRYYNGFERLYMAENLGREIEIIDDWEKAVISPSFSDLMKLCKIYDTSPNKLTGYEEDKELKEFWDRLKNTVAQNIKALRLMNDYKQSYVGYKLDKKYHTSVSNYETGRILPTEEDIDKLCELYGINKNQLFGKEKIEGIEPYIDECKEKEKTSRERKIKKLLNEQSRIEDEIEILQSINKHRNRRKKPDVIDIKY